MTSLLETIILKVVNFRFRPTAEARPPSQSLVNSENPSTVSPRNFHIFAYTLINDSKNDCLAKMLGVN